MNIMDCSKNKEKLELFLDGELTEAEQKELMEHIDNCSYCSRHYNSESCLRKALRTKLPRLIVPRATVDNIRDNIQKIA